MSDYYPQFPHTNFPDSIDSWEDKVDVSSSTLSLVKQYNQLFDVGEIQAAQQLLINNPDLVKILVNADDINQIQQGVMALQTMFTEDIDSYLAQSTMPKGTYDPNNIEGDAFLTANHLMSGYQEIEDYTPPNEDDSTLVAIEKIVAGITTNAEQISALQGAIIYIGNIELETTNVTQAALNSRAAALGYSDLITGHTLVDLNNANWWYNSISQSWIQIGSGIEVATNSTPGIVQGSTTDGKVSVGSDGTMTVNNIITKSGGAFTGAVSGPSISSEDAIYRNIQIGTTDLTPGTSALASGAIYLVYEE